MQTRREFGKMSLAAIGAAAAYAAQERRTGGVRLGVQSWSFRDRDLDGLLDALVKLKVGYCELSSTHVEPARMSDEELRTWRLSVSPDEFRKMRQKFADARVVISGYSAPIASSWTPEEISRAFEMVRALGTNLLTCSIKVSQSAQIDGFAVRTNMRVGLHNHSRVEPDELASPQSFAAALQGRSRHVGVNLDTGHYVAAGFDPLAYLKAHHGRIFSLHLKDRKKNQGPRVPFGEGDTPNAQILRTLKQQKWDIPALIEFEIKGADPIAGVDQALEYCRRVLA